MQEFEAGIMLVGTEVKAIKVGDANITDAFCTIIKDELYVRNLYIAEYKFGNKYNHETRRDRKLLLKRNEIKKLDKKVKEKGYSIVPYKIYLSDRGIIKLQIHLATGKKSYDKRNSIKEKDQKREMDRMTKANY